MKYIQSGKLDGPTIIFIHGWPDTPLVWQHQLKVLEANYRCVCLMLPGYDFDPAGSKFPSFGVSLTNIAKDAADTIQNKIMVDRPAEDDKPFLIAHDWGCTIGYMLTTDHPNLFKKCIMLDVAQHAGPSPLAAQIFFVAYQWALIAIFLLPRFLGTPLAKGFAKFWGAPDVGNVRQSMHHLYFQYWKAMLTGEPHKSAAEWNPPQCPILFMYGTRLKPSIRPASAKFYSQRWLDHLEKTPGCSSIAVPADHWFYVRAQHRDEVNTQMVKFLSAPMPES